MNRKNDTLEYKLSKSTLVFLLIYFIFIVIYGIICSIRLINVTGDINSENLFDAFSSNIINIISISAMMNGVQYIIRLYKAAINNRIVPPEKWFTMEEIGNFAYFMTRPMIAIVFTQIFMLITLFSLLTIINNVASVDFIRLLYLCILASATIGFSIGNIIDTFSDICKTRTLNNNI